MQHKAVYLLFWKFAQKVSDVNHPSSGVHKTVTTPSDTVQLPPSNVANLCHVGGRQLHKKYDQYGRL